MSEKKRQKKDGERKDKDNQAMRESVSERKPQQESAPQGGRPNNSTTDEPGAGATDNARGQGSNR